MDCPRCGSGRYIKDGFSCGRQRYECKQCQNHYTVTRRSNERPPETRQLALDLYLEGLGFRAIGRILKVSNTAVLGWIKKSGEAVKLQVADEPVEVAEVDEMHSFVGQKKLPLALDCGKSFGQTVFGFCVWRSFDSNGLAVMGQVKAFVCRFVCNGSLAELRRVHSTGAALADKSGNLHGRRIQQSHSPLSGKIQKENKVLQQVRRNDRNITQSTHEKTE